MPRRQLTLEAHKQLTRLYGAFGDAALPRSRFRIHRAYDALDRMEKILTAYDSWELCANGNGKKKGKTNGKARVD